MPRPLLHIITLAHIHFLSVFPRENPHTDSCSFGSEPTVLLAFENPSTLFYAFILEWRSGGEIGGNPLSWRFVLTYRSLLENVQRFAAQNSTAVLRRRAPP